MKNNKIKRFFAAALSAIAVTAMISAPAYAANATYNCPVQNVKNAASKAGNCPIMPVSLKNANNCYAQQKQNAADALKNLANCKNNAAPNAVKVYLNGKEIDCSGNIQDIINKYKAGTECKTPAAPADNGGKKPVETKPQKPEDTTPRYPVETKPQKPEDTTPRYPVETKPQKPEDTTPRYPVETKPQKPEDTTPRYPVETKPQKPEDTTPRYPVETKPQKPEDTTPRYPVETKPQKPAETPASSVSAIEREVVALVNEIRASYGLSALTINEELSKVARIKAEDMATNKYFSHTSPTYGSPFDMMKKFGISYRAAGENIAMGYSSAKAVVDGWMNSEGHRANILNASFTQIGVGYTANGNYWCQMFIG